MTKRRLIGEAVYGIGGAILVLSGAYTIGHATTETNDMFVGMAFMAIGVFGLFRALLSGFRN